MRLAILCALVCLASSAAAQKTDVIVLDNGDHVTGEIKKLNHGLLHLSTDHMGTVEIEWAHIENVTSTENFVVETEGGDRFYGTLELARDEGASEVLGPSRESVEMPDVVEMSPLNRSFWDQVDGSMDLGFSFTQANSVTTWTAAANAAYRTRDYLTAVGYSSYLNTQEEADSITRNVINLSLSRFFGDRWFGFGLTQFLQSTELGVDLRTTAGGGLGRHIIQTNESELSPSVGLVYSNSIFTGETTDKNEVLALIGIQYSIFTFGRHKTELTTSAVYLPSLTESGHYRVDVDAQVRVKLFRDFYVSFNLYENFDNDPPPGGTENDFGVSTSLGWSF